MKTQIIGLDIGRGYVKAFSVYEGRTYQTIFNSVVGTGRDGIDYSNFENPINLEINDDQFFFGELAIKESYNKVSNIKDEKTTDTAEKLLIAALSQVAVAENVKIMLGVPNRLYRKQTRANVIEKYKNMSYIIKDKVAEKVKKIHIADVDIFRESDSALIYLERGKVNKSPIALVSIGYKTTEISYYEPNFRFIDRNSTSLALGQTDINVEVRRKLERERIYKDVAEIDISSNYDDKKRIGYEMVSNRLYEEIDGIFTNINEMEKIYVCGGTSQNLELDDSIFTKVENPQMATAKGLFFVGNRRFNMEE